MNKNLQTVSFYGTNLLSIQVDNVVYVAMRPIVEALGLDWKAQHRKLTNNKDKFNYGHMTTTGKDGKSYKMTCLPLKKLNGWLFSINPEKVRADLKEKVIKYQEECFQVLHDYWTTGVAINPRLSTKEERKGLRDAVNLLVAKKNIDYSDAYHLIHQRFDIESVEELNQNQINDVIQYVHSLIVKGNELPALTPEYFTLLAQMIAGASKYAQMQNILDSKDGKEQRKILLDGWLESTYKKENRGFLLLLDFELNEAIERAQLFLMQQATLLQQF